MKTISTIAAFVALCLLGCHGHGDHGHEAGPEGHGADHEDAGGLELRLDDGKKWQVDESTRESATRLAALVGGTESIGTVEDARALGKALDGELDTLVKGCKMTGPAHDQLHVFLVALFPQVTALEEQTELADLQVAREEIGELLGAYNAHFE